MDIKYVIDNVAKMIAGDIVWSDSPGYAMRKWREIFKFSQNDVAKIMGISSSVIADYERGKRAPGSNFVKKFVSALIELDGKREYAVVKELAKSFTLNLPYVEDLMNFSRPIDSYLVVKAIDGIVPTSYFKPDVKVYGYLVADSIKAIMSLSGLEFYQFLALSIGRAFVFTKVTTGRSPLIALKIAPIRPPLIILHRPIRLDPLALYLAEKEQINLVVSTKGSEDEVIEALRSLVVQLE